MGLREMKARRTRDALHHAALTLSEDRGYETVTVEMIAERAEVGISTLYRYFPHKDAILLEPVASNVRVLADVLRGRPADEPCDVALGQALLAYFSWAPEDHERVARRRQLDRAAGPRAGLWDLWYEQRTLLEAAIAEREDADPAELWVTATAQTVMMIVQLTVDRARSGTDDVPLYDVLGEVIAAIHGGRLVVPTLPAGSAD
jgi:AcrR family transcriptional regulator